MWARYVAELPTAAQSFGRNSNESEGNYCGGTLAPRAEPFQREWRIRFQRHLAVSTTIPEVDG